MYPSNFFQYYFLSHSHNEIFSRNFALPLYSVVRGSHRIPYTTIYLFASFFVVQHLLSSRKESGNKRPADDNFATAKKWWNGPEPINALSNGCFGNGKRKGNSCNASNSIDRAGDGPWSKRTRLPLAPNIVSSFHWQVFPAHKFRYRHPLCLSKLFR